MSQERPPHQPVLHHRVSETGGAAFVHADDEEGRAQALLAGRAAAVPHDGTAQRELQAAGRQLSHARADEAQMLIGGDGGVQTLEMRSLPGDADAVHSLALAETKVQPGVMLRLQAAAARTRVMHSALDAHSAAVERKQELGALSQGREALRHLPVQRRLQPVIGCCRGLRTVAVQRVGRVAAGVAVQLQGPAVSQR